MPTGLGPGLVQALGRLEIGTEMMWTGERVL